MAHLLFLPEECMKILLGSKKSALSTYIHHRRCIVVLYFIQLTSDNYISTVFRDMRRNVKPMVGRLSSSNAAVITAIGLATYTPNYEVNVVWYTLKVKMKYLAMVWVAF